MKIEIEWKAKPASGVMQVDLTDLGYSNSEWLFMNAAERKAALQTYLTENEEKIIPLVVDFYQTNGDYFK